MTAYKVLLISLFLFSNTAVASDCGLFRVVKGKVEHKKARKKKYKKTYVNRKVCVGDSVRTKEDSRAKIEMASGDVINISPQTEFLIEELAKNKVQLHINYGQLRSKVKHKYQDNDRSHYRIKTRSAVAGVRGTDFVFGFNHVTNESRVVTFEGTVALGAEINGVYTPQVQVKAGFFTGSQGSGVAHEPQRLSADQINQMNQDTEVAPSPKPSNRAPTNERKNDNTKKERSPNSVGNTNSQSPSRATPPVHIDQVIIEIENDILGGNSPVEVEIDLADVPDLTGPDINQDILPPRPVAPDNLIDNLIQNNKATVNFNIGVKE